MGLFDVLKETVVGLLDDGAKESTLYSRRLGADELLRLRFQLPEPEALMAQLTASVQTVPLGAGTASMKPVDDVFDGKLFLSQSFLMFESFGDPRVLNFVVPLSTIRRVERLPSRSSLFALKITLYQDLQLLFQFDGMFSSCEEFCGLLGANLKNQVPLAKQLRQIGTSFYSEFLVESAVRRRKGESKQKITAELIVPPGGLGRAFGYPGDAKLSHERSKMRLWLEYFTGHGRNIGIVRQQGFYKLIRVGLPNALRGEIWELCCGSVHERMKSRSMYTSLLDENADKTSLATEEIAKDLNRSLPEYPAYQTPEGIERLRRVLVAYSWMCPEVGYCQAMNIVTAALLIYQTEEQAFWTLHMLVTRTLPGYYSRTMYGMLLDQKVLESLVEKTMPMLWQHFVNTDVPLSVVSLPWFLSLFVNSMPIPYAFRIIDILMLEGSRVLFQISLAILRVNGDALLDATDNTAVIEVLKTYFDTLDHPANPKAHPGLRQVTKFQELMVTAFKEFSVVTDDWIRSLRAKNEGPVLEDIEKYAKRTQIRNISPKPRCLNNDATGIVYDKFYATMQATRPALGGNHGELSFYQFVTFLSALADWVSPQYVPRDEAEVHPFLHRLFTKWDVRGQGSLCLGDCVLGLDNLINPDMMELINYFFELYCEDKNGGLNSQDILEVADAFLLIMRPFSPKTASPMLLDALSQAELSKVGNTEDEGAMAEALEQVKQRQSARCLAAVSSFIQRAFDVAGLKSVQPQISDRATVAEPESLIDLPEKEAAPEQKLSLPHFRMVLLADETLELFFSETLQSSLHLTEHGTGILSMKPEPGLFRSMMDNVVRDGLRIADGLWSQGPVEVSDEKQDELGDDMAVQASDRALLDL